MLLGFDKPVTAITNPTANSRTGITAAVLAAGLDPAEAVLEFREPFGAAGGEAATEQLLAIPSAKRPTAVFCINDAIALGALRTLARAGVSVPGEMAVIGYDDQAFARDLVVPLSSVHQPMRKLGETAADMLLLPPGAEPDHVLFKPELIVRKSSDPNASE